MTEVALLEQKDLRQQVIGRVEVLGKVKELFLIPQMEVMTVKQVAKYFEVDDNTLEMCYKRNRDEIESDGVVLKSINEIKGVHFVPIRITQGKTTFQLADNITIEIPNRGIKCFSKRAILRIAMLLRDSEVAKEVRTQLLNTFEQSTPEQRTTDIDEEMKLQLEIGKASMSGDVQQINIAYEELYP